MTKSLIGQVRGTEKEPYPRKGDEARLSRRSDALRPDDFTARS